MSGMKYKQGDSIYYVPSVDLTEVYNEAKAECGLKHFAAVVEGDGSKAITFGPVNFDPDVVEIICYRGVHDAGNVSNVIQLATFDLRAKNGIDNLCGISLLSNVENTSDPLKAQNVRQPATSLSTENISAKFNKDAYGNITASGFVAHEQDDKGVWTSIPGVFGAGCKYICTAIKVTE